MVGGNEMYYPVFLDLSGCRVLVVGGGQVAERKVAALLKCGAAVFVVSQNLTPGLHQMKADSRICWQARDFRPEFLAGARLAIAATDDHALNTRVSVEARRRGIFVNAVDQPQDCDFIVPAVVRRGDLQIAVSTSGRSPALAKLIREQLEEQFGPEYGDFLWVMGRVRTLILDAGAASEENRDAFNRLVRSDLFEAIAGQDWQHAEEILLGVMPMASPVQELVAVLRTRTLQRRLSPSDDDMESETDNEDPVV